MIIQKLTIKNFRPIDQVGIELEPNHHMNVIVGENNTGKSAILAAMDMLKQCLYFEQGNPPPRRRYTFQQFDWHRGNTKIPIEVKALVKLSLPEVATLLEIFKGATDLQHLALEIVERTGVMERIREELCQSVEVGVHWMPEKPENEAQYIKCGFLYVKNNAADMRLRSLPSRTVVWWEDLLQEYMTEKTVSHTGATFEEHAVTLQEVAARKFKEKEEYVINFRLPEGSKNVEEQVVDVIAPKLKAFADIRLRPQVEASAALESLDGREMASVLFNLRTSRDINLRSKYERIKKKFQELFDYITFESVEGPDIVFLNSAVPDYQIPVQAVGTGVVETLIFVTNLTGTEDNVLLIDTPELHLHPHAERLLGELFKEYENNNQIFVVTHSPYFVRPDEIGAHIRVTLTNGKTQKRSLPQNYFTEAELSKIEQILLEPGHREMFFARKVVLVEGSTELGAMPVFASRLGNLLDKAGVSVISVGGKKDFYMFMKLLRGFLVPFLVLTDKDALMQITDHLKVGDQTVPTTSILSQLARLGFLTSEEQDFLQQLASSQSIVSRKSGKGEPTMWYKEEHFERLKDIAHAYNCLVLPGTFEQVLTDAGFGNLIAEAEQEVGNSKVRQGRYIASRIPPDRIPDPFVEVIRTASAM